MYFSGFSLQNESELFNKYIISNDFTVSGFSYGAIKALEYTLNTTNRVDTLQLFSPAYFNDKDKKYRRLQMIFFNKDNESYCNNFLENSGFDKQKINKYFKIGTSKELEELLYYKWCSEKCKELLDRNIKIEVYLGSDDKIVNTQEALEFFRQFAEVYYIKEASHILI